MPNTTRLQVLEAYGWWLGRVVAALMVMMVSAIIIGEGAPPVWRMPLSESAMFFMLVAMLGGCVVGMFRRVVGALLIAVSLLGFDLFNVAGSGRLPGPFIHLFLVPAVLYLLSAHFGITAKLRAHMKPAH